MTLLPVRSGAMNLTVAMVTVDSHDPGTLAAWWAGVVGGEVDRSAGPSFYLLRREPGPWFGFQHVADPTPGKNRLHVDLEAADVDAAVAELTRAGAGLVGWRGDDGFRWATLADPDGNEFCVSGPH